jgi:inner membrane protein involved in colicin E2 resistance
MRFPLFVRGVLIAALGAALLLPLWLIQNKVTERRQRADQVQTTFAAEAGGAQVLAGPFLVVGSQVLTPRRLEAKGELNVEQRFRGIFPVRLYRGALAFSGEFDWPEGEAPKPGERAYLVLSISDPRGIKDTGNVDTGKVRARFAPGARGIYGALYLLLKSEDHAMLLGSILVFVALATAMILTRRLDWNALSRRLTPQPTA